MSRIFGTDGVRGLANSQLTCELALNIGRAVAAALIEDGEKRPKIIIGKDTRVSSDMLEGALKSGICSAGADALIVGIIPTPAIAFLVKAYEADAGIMISASHNPYQFNGIKIFDKNGYKLPDKTEDRIEKLTFEGLLAYKYPTGKDIGGVDYASDAIFDYINHLKSTVESDFKGMKIAIDCANGAAYEAAEELFCDLGAEFHMLNNAPDGININENCGSTHLKGLSEYVVQNKMDLGIAFDGDADRCIAVDENGETVDGDAIMAICALDMAKRGKLSKNTVVGTVMTNMGFSKFCEKRGINFEATKVGDRYVLENMLKNGYNFGGEQSGHIIFHDFSTTGDGELTALQLIDALKRQGIKLSEAKKVFETFPQVIVNVNVDNNKKYLINNDDEVLRALSEAQKVLDGNGRIVVRESGTEPLVRVMVECMDMSMIKGIADKVAVKISERLS